MSNPKISILMPVYNAEKYIKETLDTVLAQSFKDWEVIVMDGVSKDKTVEIAKEYAAKYPNIHVYSEPDEGVYHAIHKALDRATGDFICVLCASDGYANADWLKLCMDVFDKDPEVSLVWGIPVDVTEEGKYIGPHFAYAHLLKEKGGRGPFIKEMLKRVSSPSSFMRLMKKLNASNLATAREVMKSQEPPRKKEGFEHWLKTGMIFPDGNMCVSKKAMKECLAPYHPGTREAGDWMQFFFDINAKGYLCYCIPVMANFTRSNEQGSVTARFQEYNDKNREVYFKKLDEFRKEVHDHPEIVVFHDRAGNVIS